MKSILKVIFAFVFLFNLTLIKPLPVQAFYCTTDNSSITIYDSDHVKITTTLLGGDHDLTEGYVLEHRTGTLSYNDTVTVDSGDDPVVTFIVLISKIKDVLENDDNTITFTIDHNDDDTCNFGLENNDIQTVVDNARELFALPDDPDTDGDSTSDPTSDTTSTTGTTGSTPVVGDSGVKSESANCELIVSTGLGNIPVEPLCLTLWVLKNGILMGSGIAFLLSIWGAITILLAAGNPDKINEGKQIITSAITGLLVIVLSVFLLRLIGYDILKLPGFKLT